MFELAKSWIAENEDENLQNILRGFNPSELNEFIWELALARLVDDDEKMFFEDLIDLKYIL